MKYVLRYRVKIPNYKGISDFMDMFRYSGDWIEELKSRKVFIVRHFLQHRRRGKNFWKSQIKIRWESFGAEIELLEESNATDFDKNYRYKKGVIPIIEGHTKYDIEQLSLENA